MCRQAPCAASGPSSPTTTARRGMRRGGRLLGVECKRTDAPRVTPSIKIALADLELDRVAVVYPGERRYPLADRVEAVPVGELAEHGRL